MAINYDDFLNLTQDELEKCQDLIENLLLIKQQQHFHYLTSFDAPGLTKAFRLDRKPVLPEKAWQHFWDNVHPFMLEEKDLPFFKLICSLDHFYDYEEGHFENSRFKSDKNIRFSEEVILNSLKNASAIRSLIEEVSLDEKIRHYLNDNTYWFHRRFGVTQEALDVLIEKGFLDLTTDEMQAKFYSIDKQDVAENPGLLACYQAAMRHDMVGFDNEHIAQQVILFWSKANMEFLEGLPDAITENLDLHKTILRLPQSDYDNEKLLKLKLITWVPESYATFFNNHPDNFTWSLGLKHDNWDMLEKDIDGVTKGLINSYDRTHCLKPEWTFNNIRQFLSRVHEDNSELYGKLIQRAKELNANSGYGSIEFEKALGKILLHENLSEKLLNQASDDNQDEYLSSSRLKI